jgi:predicted nucleic acid-binding protein
MRIVLDTSVVGKIYFKEPDSAAAVGLLSRTDLDIAAPEQLLVELASVAWKRMRKGDIDGSQAQTILRQAAVLPIQLHSDARLVEDAMALAVEIGSSVYDSLYLALAIMEGRQVVSADLRFVKPLRTGRYGNYVRSLDEM